MLFSGSNTTSSLAAEKHPSAEPVPSKARDLLGPCRCDVQPRTSRDPGLHPPCIWPLLNSQNLIRVFIPLVPCREIRIKVLRVPILIRGIYFTPLPTKCGGFTKGTNRGSPPHAASWTNAGTEWVQARHIGITGLIPAESVPFRQFRQRTAVFLPHGGKPYIWYEVESSKYPYFPLTRKLFPSPTYCCAQEAISISRAVLTSRLPILHASAALVTKFRAIHGSVERSRYIPVNS